MKRNSLTACGSIVALVLGLSPPVSCAAAPLGAAFTYQGQLKEDGIPVNGAYDLQFRLYDAVGGGDQIGSVVQETDLTITNGMFTVRLDFGAGAFNGDARWLQISVARAFSGNYSVLSPRQALTAAPYAVYATTVPNSLLHWAANGNHIYNTNTANVGIGTTLAGRRLQIGSTAVPDSEGLIRLASRSGTQGSNRIWDIGVPETDADTSGPGYSFVIDDTQLGTGPEFMVKYGSGNVGIGTVTPAAKLHVEGGSDASLIGGGYFVIGSAAGANIVMDNNEIMARNAGAASGLYLNHQGGNVLISAGGDGNVGIGTSTPIYKLHVVDESSGATAINAHGAGTGVWGSSKTGGYGVFGQTPINESGFGVYSSGRFGASGTKLFHIDHPLDPANKYLNHYCAEGPDPLLIYRGNILLDANGEAWVQLPNYFEAMNRDYHYQLTCVGRFAPVYVAEEIRDGRFKIAGGQPGVKVSWTVTGVRNDPFVRVNGAPVETEKPEQERGKYLHPELFGKPADLGIHSLPELRSAE